MGVKKVAESVAARRAAKKTGIDPRAVDVVKETLKADAEGAGGRLAQAGDGAMLADAGPNARALLDVAIQKSGPAGFRARKAIDNRVSVASERITQVMDDTLGVPEGVRAISAKLRSSTADARNETYRAAYAARIDYDSPAGKSLEEALINRVRMKHIKEANILIRESPVKAPHILAKEVTLPDGTRILKFNNKPTVQQIDYITRGINKASEKEAGKGALGGATDLGGSAKILARDVRSALKSSGEAGERYAKALDTAADPISKRKALKLGSISLRPSMTVDDLAEAADGMGGAELRHVAQGMRETIENATANVKKAFSDPNMDAREAAVALRELSSRATRDKVTMIIGKDKAKQLFESLDSSTVAFEMKAAVAQNSKTFAREALNQRVDQRLNQGAMRALAAGSPVRAGREAAASVLGGDATSRAAAADVVYRTIVDTLTGPGGVKALEKILKGTAPAQVGKNVGRIAESAAARAPLAGLSALPTAQ